MKPTSEEYARYERHLMVEGFGEAGQQKLKAARVLVVGAGGLGSAVLQYLTAAGVGTIGIVENDIVTPSNLNRQVLYTAWDIGAPKADRAEERLTALNPHTKLTIHPIRLTATNARELFQNYDAIIDCTDNYATRYVIDRFCGELGIPMIYGTAQESRGQVSVFHTPGAKTYADLYPEINPDEDSRPVGVLSPMPGIVGTIQAMEALKLITGYGRTLAGRLLLIDAADMRFTLFDL